MWSDQYWPIRDQCLPDFLCTPRTFSRLLGHGSEIRKFCKLVSFSRDLSALWVYCLFIHCSPWLDLGNLLNPRKSGKRFDLLKKTKQAKKIWIESLKFTFLNPLVSWWTSEWLLPTRKALVGVLYDIGLTAPCLTLWHTKKNHTWIKFLRFRRNIKCK